MSPRAALVLLALAVAAPLSAAPAAKPAPAPAPAAKAAILGHWEGTSICTQIPGNGACRDEHVFYLFTPLGGDSVHLDARKLVAGEIQPMGEMDFAYVPAAKRWECLYHSRRGDILWAFSVKDSALTGTLEFLPGHERARNASARRRGPW